MEFHPLKEADFPPKLQKHYRWVMKQLTKRGPMFDHKGEVYRGSVEHTLSHMRNSTGSKIAERLLMLHDRVEEALRIRRMRPLAARPNPTRAKAARAVRRRR